MGIAKRRKPPLPWSTQSQKKEKTTDSKITDCLNLPLKNKRFIREHLSPWWSPLSFRVILTLTLWGWVVCRKCSYFLKPISITSAKKQVDRYYASFTTKYKMSSTKKNNKKKNSFRRNALKPSQNTLIAYMCHIDMTILFLYYAGRLLLACLTERDICWHV